MTTQNAVADPAAEDTLLLHAQQLHHSQSVHKSLGDDVPLYARREFLGADSLNPPFFPVLASAS
jgi:hypothetical protein